MGIAADFPSVANSTRLITARSADADFVLHVGDIAYAMGHAAKWSAFGEQVQRIASRVPYMVAIGNHEYDFPAQPFKPLLFTYGNDGGGECGVPYNARFHMPGPPLSAQRGDFLLAPRGGPPAAATAGGT